MRNRSLWLDLRLIFRSVAISLLGGWPEVDRDEEQRNPPLDGEAGSPA